MLSRILFALALCGCAFIAVRAYLFEETTFSPPHGPLYRPEWLTVEGDFWVAPPVNGRVIVLAHGSPATRVDLLPEAKSLHDHGFGVVLFDFVGHGERPGEVHWDDRDRHVLTEAISVAHQKGHVGLLGFSMGSCIAALVTAEDARVEALVLEGAYTDLKEQLRYEFGRYGPLSQLPAIISAQSGIALWTMRPIDVIAQIDRPLLLIAGSDDHTVPPAMSEELFARAKGHKELWIIPHARHGHYEQHPDYFDRLARFFSENVAAGVNAPPR